MDFIGYLMIDVDHLINGVGRLGTQPWVVSMITVLAAWTLTVLAVRLALTLLPDRHAVIHYHFRMALLYSLPLMAGVAVLVNVFFQPVTLPDQLNTEWINTHIITVNSTAFTDTIPENTPSLLSSLTTFSFFTGSLLILTIFMALIGWIRMGFQIRSLLYLRRNPGLRVHLETGERKTFAMDYHDSVIPRYTRDLCRKLGINKQVAVYRHPEAAVPMTIGWLRPKIILPWHSSEKWEIELTLHHELLHIRRNHFVLQAMEESVKCLFFIHPLIHLLTREIRVFREMTCDSELLATSDVSKHEYASLLFHSLPESGKTTPLPLSVSMSANSDIKTRIKSMAHYPRETNIWHARRHVSIMLAVVIIMPTLLLAACDFGAIPGSVNDPSRSNDEWMSTPVVLSMVDEMPKPVGGLESIYDHLYYPKEARESGIAGRVHISFVIDSDGTPTQFANVNGEENHDEMADETLVFARALPNLHVKHSADNEIFYDAVVEALRNSRWNPGRQHGQPVSVKITKPFVFKLNTEY